jgi:hypothetical protein
MIQAGIWAIRLWPIVLGGLLLLSAYGLWRDHNETVKQLGRTEERMEVWSERARTAELMAAEAAETTQRQADASQKLLAELQSLRRKYGKNLTILNQTRAAAATGDCISLPVHPDVERLFHGAEADVADAPG